MRREGRIARRASEEGEVLQGLPMDGYRQADNEQKVRIAIIIWLST
jgi:hypothetical protein